MNRMMHIIAAVAALSANADTTGTVTTNGVTWTYSAKDDTAKTVTLGNGSSPCIAKDAEYDASAIPGKFVIDGETYTVTALAKGVFSGCAGLKGVLKIPGSVTTADGNNHFNGCSGLTGVSSWGGLTGLTQYFFLRCTNLKGPLPSFSTLSSTSYGTFREASLLSGVCINGSFSFYSSYAFWGATALKVLLFGPNMTHFNSSDRTLAGVSNCKVVGPSVFSSFNPGGSNTEIITYGPEEEITSLEINEDARYVTMTPTTADAFLKGLELAQLFKTHLDLDTRISVTNAIDLAGVTITEDMVSGASFDRLMFAVTTQAELNSVLAAFEAFPSVPIAIDPSGITEDLAIPISRKVYVQLSESDKVRLITKGLKIIFR